MPQSNAVLSRKRRRPEQPEHSEHSHHPSVPSPKRQKIKHPSGSRPPPEFWDNLSKFWLTKRAIREFDRRNSQPSLRARRFTRSAVGQWREDPNNRHQTEHIAAVLKSPSRKFLKNIKAFAKQGGPDLSDLKGYTQPVDPLEYKMSKESRDLANKSTSETVAQTKPTKKSGPYDPNFLQNLVDHGVYPYGHDLPDDRAPPLPDNLEELNRRMTQSRASLSPSRFPDTKFREFVLADARAKKEPQVTSYVIPYIEGEIKNGNCRAGQIRFTNLDHLTDGNLVSGNPDLFYGSPPQHLNRTVRGELSGKIMPSTQQDLPMAPNFFLAAKGPDGGPGVAERQALYDGALGARGIHSLQSYGQDQPTYNNKAYTITSSYCNGTLKLYTTHPSPPSMPQGRSEYYMTPVRSWSLTDTPNTFKEGVAAFRNSRDWAKEQRQEAIRRANEKFAARSANVLPVDVQAASTAYTRATKASRQPHNTEHVAQESQSSMYEDIEPAANLQQSDTSSDELAVAYEVSAKKQRVRRRARPSKHPQLKKRIV